MVGVAALRVGVDARWGIASPRAMRSLPLVMRSIQVANQLHGWPTMSISCSTNKFVDVARPSDLSTLRLSDPPASPIFQIHRLCVSPTLGVSDSPILRCHDSRILWRSESPIFQSSDSPSARFSDAPASRFSEHPILSLSNSPSLPPPVPSTLRFTDSPIRGLSDSPTLGFLRFSDSPTRGLSDTLIHGLAGSQTIRLSDVYKVGGACGRWRAAFEPQIYICAQHRSTLSVKVLPQHRGIELERRTILQRGAN